MEAVCFSEKLVSSYKSTSCYNPEDQYQQYTEAAVKLIKLSIIKLIMNTAILDSIGPRFPLNRISIVVGLFFEEI
jgi:hypothetical protein